MLIGSKEVYEKMNKCIQNFEGEICVMIDETDIPSKPYGVYSFVGNVLVGAYYFETEEEAQLKYKKIIEGLKKESYIINIDGNISLNG